MLSYKRRLERSEKLYCTQVGWHIYQNAGMEKEKGSIGERKEAYYDV
jgi:hypothetical protein